MKTLYISLFAMLALFSSPALAAEGWDDHASHMLKFQILNVVVLFGALVYFLKDVAANHFKARATEYQTVAHQAQQELDKAKEEFNEIQARLAKVETTWAEALSRAEAEAVAHREQLALQAQEVASRVVEDAKRAMGVEVNKVNHQMLEELVTLAKAKVETQLRTQLSPEDHKRLQRDFNQSVQGSQS